MSADLQAEILFAIIGALLNGAVTWGIVSTKLAWMRRDIDELRKWRETFLKREAA